MRRARAASRSERKGGGSSASPARKNGGLLAVLATACPSVVSVDSLLDLLWEGSPPPTARKSLQAHVVRLRSALEPDRPRGSPGRFVVRRQTGYALSLSRDELDWFDVRGSRRAGPGAVVRGRASGRPLSAHRSARLVAGRAVCRLARGFVRSRGASPPHGDLDPCDRGLLRVGAALGRHVEVVPELERLAAGEPLNEDWWSLLAVALYRSGRQADALSALRRARSHLADELGLDPGPRDAWHRTGSTRAGRLPRRPEHRRLQRDR